MTREIKIELPTRTTTGPARGWADAYRETLETLWAGLQDDCEPTEIHQAPEVVALVAFAAEIRAGITAGLLTAGLVAATPVVRVPLVGATRDERPRAEVTGNGDADLVHAAAHLPVRDPEDERILRGGFNPAAEPIDPNR
jgi:hypothetical protein